MPRSVVLDIGGVLEVTPPTGWQARWERDAGLTQGAVLDLLGDVFAAGSVGTVTEAEALAAARARLEVTPAMLDRFWSDPAVYALTGERPGWSRQLGRPAGSPSSSATPSRPSRTSKPSSREANPAMLAGRAP